MKINKHLIKGTCYRSLGNFKKCCKVIEYYNVTITYNNLINFVGKCEGGHRRVTRMIMSDYLSLSHKLRERLLEKLGV